MTRRATDRPQPRVSAERRWYEQSISTLEAERLKLRSETASIREDLKTAEWERRLRETSPRGRREYDLAEEVTEDSVAVAVAELSEWAAESVDPITLRVISPGGDVVQGLALYDFVVKLREDGLVVNTVALGWAASMAAVLLQCGTTRYVARNAFMLIHEERTTYTGDWTEKITDMEDRLKFGWMLEERNDAILAERSVFTVEQLRERYARKDWWLPAEEALELGFADELWSGGGE